MTGQVDDAQENEGTDEGAEEVSYTAVLLTQGNHRFYTLAMPTDVLAETCVVDPRVENPIDGFQRLLDEKRAHEIADYIDNGFGTIPGSIILSAQPQAELEYTRKSRTIKFRKTPRSFLILDGQHRVYGFKLAKTHLRVPVVIYNKLTRAEETRLFMDINTKQRPVPPELILDIKRLAEIETDSEALLRDVFDTFNKDPASPLFGLLSPSERKPGKISRVTFNQSVKPIWSSLSNSDYDAIYAALCAYLHAWTAALKAVSADNNLTNPTLFKAIMLAFPTIAQRVSDRFDADYSQKNFGKILNSLFENIKKNDVLKPGTSHKALHETFRKALSAGFSLGKTK
ncbi:hypothetical protein DK389_02770 [Methylobacterium durans]|uniref:DGQHR domain-containing protein n=2 Tax=Methylobacterium durans TaxID=2202825 RepID=A0A2U8W2C4_9HYPH|nr:hypothetical protein DK389_02770 [Methylobacterium durans]